MTPDYWPEACAALAKRDAVMRKLIRTYPEAALRTRGDAFGTLARSIVGQQISVKAAQSVWDRFAARCEDMKPEFVLSLREDEMRACGLSGQKIKYLFDLAAHFACGEIDPDRWSSEDDDTIIAELSAVNGIGRWSAEMFLIFYLMRPNVFPVADIGLVRAIEKHYHGGERLAKDEIEAYRERWSPWATVATWYLWRSLDPLPVEY